MLIKNSVNMEYQMSKSKPAPKKIKLAKVTSKPNGDPLGDMGRKCEVTWDDFKFVLYYDVTSGEMYDLDFYVEVYQIKRGKEVYLGKFSKLTPEQLVQAGKKYGKQIPLIQKISASKENKMKQRINSEFLLNIPKRICEKYNIKVPADIAMDFYNDMVNAFKNRPLPNSRRALNNEVQMYEVYYKYTDSNGQTINSVDKVAAESEDEARKIAVEAYRNNAGTKDVVGEIEPYIIKPVQNSRRAIKNSVQNDWRQVAHNLYPNVWKYWFSDVAKEADKGNGFNRQTFDYGVQMIVDRGGRDESYESKFFLQFANAYYTAQREGKLNEFLDNLYEDISNMAKYEGYRVTNSRRIKSEKEDDNVVDAEEVWERTKEWMTNPLAAAQDTVARAVLKNSFGIEDDEVFVDATVLTPFGEIDRTVANADFTDETMEAYVVEPYAESSDGQFTINNEDSVKDTLPLRETSLKVSVEDAPVDNEVVDYDESVTDEVYEEATVEETDDYSEESTADVFDEMADKISDAISETFREILGE